MSEFDYIDFPLTLSVCENGRFVLRGVPHAVYEFLPGRDDHEVKRDGVTIKVKSMPLGFRLRLVFESLPVPLQS